MKALLLAALVAIAVAAPRNGLVTPIAAGPEPVIMPDVQPIAIGPAIIDSFDPVAASPVSAAAPLVQMIININTAVIADVPVAPVVVPRPTPTPVQVVDVAPIPVEPIQVVQPAIPIEPVIIGTPVLPSPAITLPEELN